ncbi:MAG: HTH domain-containing protein, partial [Chlorobi bacterium]|nr:HTH domain-containing protein [Chlorobiota bacterium]
MEVKDKVLQTLKDSSEPLKGGEIAEKSGIEKKLVDKAIKQLKTEGLIEVPKR